MKELITYAGTALTIIGGLVIIVAVITQLTKGLGFIKKIPTALYAIILSEIITVASFMAYCSWKTVNCEWYMIFGTIIGGFVVAFVASYGWDSLDEIIARYKKIAYPFPYISFIECLPLKR